MIANGGGIVSFTLHNFILKSPQLSRSKVLLIEHAAKLSNFRRPSQNSHVDGQHDNRFSLNRASSLSAVSKFAFKKLGGDWSLVGTYARDTRGIKILNYNYQHDMVFNRYISSYNKGEEIDRLSNSGDQSDNQSARDANHNLITNSKNNSSGGIEQGEATSKSEGDESLSEATAKSRPDDLYRYLWIKCSGHEPAVLDSYEKFVQLAAKNLDVKYVKTEEPFRIIKRKTLLASRHVHKKYRVQYETRTYYRDLLFKNLTGSTADTFLEYIERNLPDGVLLIAEKHRLAEFPFDLTSEKK